MHASQYVPGASDVEIGKFTQFGVVGRATGFEVAIRVPGAPELSEYIAAIISPPLPAWPVYISIDVKVAGWVRVTLLPGITFGAIDDHAEEPIAV